MRALLAALLLLAFLPAAASAQAACRFQLGFKLLTDQIPDVVGACLEDERFNPANGNSEQRTAAWHGKGGLLVWRKCDNWTAFTDGYRSWVSGPFGVQSRLNTDRFPWEGTCPDTASAGGSSAVRPIFSLGAPEVAWGPDEKADNPFHVLTTGNATVAYLANATTYAFVPTSPGLAGLRLLGTALRVGDRGQFDDCGAWLNSTAAQGSSVAGWYHAETDCNYGAPGHPTRKSVAFALSNDGGRTFTKPNYPRNQVITAPARYADPNSASEGDHHVVRVGDYYYLYFVAQRDFQVRVARSAVADGGRPGTWWKYHGGQWSEPGLGGESSPLAQDLLAQSWVAHSGPLNGYLGIAYFGDANGPTGYGLAFSDDGVTGWRRVSEQLLMTGPYWQAAPFAQAVVNYVSLVGLDGGDELGSTFWLYYMEVRPGGDFSRRYLMRRLVSVGGLPSAPTPPAPAAAPTPAPPPPAAPQPARPAARPLLRNQSTSSADTWVTTSTPPGYRLAEVLGYVYADRPAGDAMPLYDCYLSQERDHMVDILADCHANGNATVRPLGLLGWASTQPFAGSRAIYRCFNPSAAPFGNHFVTRDRGCEGHPTTTDGWRIGYIADSPDGLP